MKRTDPTAEPEISCLTELKNLSSLAPEWNRLAQHIPFRQWDWLEAWWDHYGHSGDKDNKRLCVLAIRDDHKQLMGLVPWYTHRSKWYGQVMSFLGSGDVCSEYLTVLAIPEHCDAVGSALADWLCGPARKEWDLIDLQGVDSTDRFVVSLMEELSKRGARTYQQRDSNTWRIDLPESWEAYLGILSSHHRKKLRQLDQRFFQTGRVSLCSAHTEETLSRGMEILVELHQRRQHQLGNSGCFASDCFASFHQTVAKRLYQKKQLWLDWIEEEGKPRAVSYNFLGGHTVYGYLSGMDPDAEYMSPGQLLDIAVLRRAIEKGFKVWDLLRGDEDYKAHWRAQPHACVKHQVAGFGISARLHHQIWRIGNGLGG